MRVLVTGGAGFIGSNLAAVLSKGGYDVTILDDFSVGTKENIKGFKAEVIEGSVEDEALVMSLLGKGFWVIFHEAAITDTTILNENRMMGVNVDGFRHVLNLARREKSRVVYASSAGVYGNGPVPMKENQLLHPLNAYALSKVRMDKLAMDYVRENYSIVVGLRYFNVYGPGEAHKDKSSSMILQLSQKMKNGIPPRIFKHGEQQRDFIYVKDVVDANVRASLIKKSGIANVGTGAAETFNKIIETLNGVLGTDYKPEYFDNPYNFYQNNTLADTSHAMELLGFKARYSVEEGIKEYLGG